MREINFFVSDINNIDLQDINNLYSNIKQNTAVTVSGHSIGSLMSVNTYALIIFNIRE